MNPVTTDGTIREQIEFERKCRRQYTEKWGDWLDPNVNRKLRLYNPDWVNSELQKSPDAAPPDRATGHGQSYQMSAQMYNAMQAVCRCGRPKQGTHMLKCLQAATPDQRAPPDDGGRNQLAIPRTSIGMYGWPPVSRYAHLQHLTRYVSPTNDIPGGRLTDRPYASVFIG